MLFRPVDAPRLRAALRKQELWWSGRAALNLGISRLLPPASADKLDDPETRDGFLRQAITKESDLFTRCYCARELARVGLPANAAYLTEIAFNEKPDDRDNRMMQAILQGLADKPHTSQTRQFLVALLLDKRFESYWTRLNTHMGMDMCRQYGVQAINAHAGRELIDPVRSAKSLAEIRAAVGQLDQAAPPSPPEPASQSPSR